MIENEILKKKNSCKKLIWDTVSSSWTSWAITKSRAIHKSHEPIYETNTINKAKILKSTTIDIVKLEE